MSESFKIKGKFQAYEEKKISDTFTVKKATFQIDNRSGDNKGRLEDVPFEVYGASLESVKNLKFNQEAEISFRVGANKGFVKLTAFAISPGKESDIEF